MVSARQNGQDIVALTMPLPTDKRPHLKPEINVGMTAFTVNEKKRNCTGNRLHGHCALPVWSITYAENKSLTVAR